MKWNRYRYWNFSTTFVPTFWKWQPISSWQRQEKISSPYFPNSSATCLPPDTVLRITNGNKCHPAYTSHATPFELWYWLIDANACSWFQTAGYISSPFPIQCNTSKLSSRIDNSHHEYWLSDANVRVYSPPSSHQRTSNYIKARERQVKVPMLSPFTTVYLMSND